MKSAAIPYVKDLHRMQSFYRACFQMDVLDEADDYCVLESAPWTLSLVSVPESIAATIVLSTPPLPREGVPIKLAFPVESIEGVRPVLAKFGGAVDPVTSEWEFRGAILCDGVDPEGNVIQLVQPIAKIDTQKDH